MIPSFRASTPIDWWPGMGNRLCGYVPGALQRLVRHARQAMLPWVNLRLPVTVLCGPAADCAQDARILVAGAWPWADYLPNRFFATPPRREDLGRVPLWGLRSFVESRRRDVDMVIIRVDRISARLFFRDGYLVVPEGVGSRIIVPIDLKQLARLSKSVKGDLRRVRRDGLTSTISHAASDCDFFYDTMYVPFLRKRHGDFAAVRSRRQVRRAFHRGGILWVHHGDERLAGAVFALRNRVLHFVALGTSRGRLDLMQRGALAALYMFLMQYAADYGCVRIDCGSSGPILNDGVLRYKSKWGARLEGTNAQYHYLVRWESPNPVVTTFLKRLPLIFKSTGGGLCGLTTLTDMTGGLEAKMAAIERSLWTDGLERLFIMVPSVERLAEGFNPLQRSDVGLEHRCRAVVCTEEQFSSTMAGGSVHVP